MYTEYMVRLYFDLLGKARLLNKSWENGKKSNKTSSNLIDNVRMGFSFSLVHLEFLYYNHCNCLFNILKREIKK